MLNILKLVAQVALKPYNLTDKKSYRAFLLDMISLIKPLAQKTGITFDDAILKCLEFIVNNDLLFDYVYKLVASQLQTEELLFESVDEYVILELCENAAPSNTGHPEAINPVVIVSVISQIISIINVIKNK